MANLLQHYFFPTDFYYPRTPSKTQTDGDQRQEILPAKNPNTANNINGKEHDDDMKDASNKNSSRVKATSSGMSYVPDNKQILGLHCKSDRVLCRGLMNSKLSRQVPDIYGRDNRISNIL